MNIVSHQNKVPLLMVSPVLSEILIRMILCKEQGRKDRAVTTCIPMKGNEADVPHS